MEADGKVVVPGCSAGQETPRQGDLGRPGRRRVGISGSARNLTVDPRLVEPETPDLLLVSEAGVARGRAQYPSSVRGLLLGLLVVGDLETSLLLLVNRPLDQNTSNFQSLGNTLSSI